jgi:uncharacterized damage-inducible protein DinB
MNPADAAARLERGARAIEAIVSTLDEETARRRPTQGGWSIVEVVGHLADEEREDFRTRLDHALHRADEPFPPINPEAAVSERRHQERDLRDLLRDFLAERERSLEWLRGLGEVDLAREHAAPWGGTIAAGDVLASWVVHDLLHLKQILRLLFDHARSDAEPFGVEYAGPWT